VPLDHTITRITVTRIADLVVTRTPDGRMTGKQTMIGRKPLVSYALYRAHGFFSPHLAAQTGVTAADLTIFWQALVHMWDLDRSASRGLIACRGLYVFVHAAALGSAPAHTLFDRIQLDPLAPDGMPTSFRDYAGRIRIADQELPDGVTLVRLVAG